MRSVESAGSTGRATCSRGRFPLQTVRRSSVPSRSHCPHGWIRQWETVDVGRPAPSTGFQPNDRYLKQDLTGRAHPNQLEQLG